MIGCGEDTEVCPLPVKEGTGIGAAIIDRLMCMMWHGSLARPPGGRKDKIFNGGFPVFS
jgi:hypothetical protein